jgi:hypothetical protein
VGARSRENEREVKLGWESRGEAFVWWTEGECGLRASECCRPVQGRADRGTLRCAQSVPTREQDGGRVGAMRMQGRASENTQARLQGHAKGAPTPAELKAQREHEGKPGVMRMQGEEWLRCMPVCKGAKTEDRFRRAVLTARRTMKAGAMRMQGEKWMCSGS